MAKAIIYIAGKETDKDHSTNAGYLAKKLKAKPDKYTFDNGKVPTFNNPLEMHEYLESEAGQDVVKIFVISHGNQEEISGRKDNQDYNAEQFAHLLWSRGLKTLAGLHRGASIMVAMVTCMSGAPHPKSGVIYAQQIASTFRTLSKKVANCRTIIVKGMNGLSYTTTEGRNVVYTGDESEHKAVDRAMNIAKGDFSKLEPGLQKQLVTGLVAKPRFST